MSYCRRARTDGNDVCDDGRDTEHCNEQWGNGTMDHETASYYA